MRVRQSDKIPSTREFVLGGKTHKEQRQLANILPMMQEKGLVQPFNCPSCTSTVARPESKSQTGPVASSVRLEALRRPRGPSRIQEYASHWQLYGVYTLIRKELETLWDLGGTVQELIVTMSEYNLEGRFLDYVF